MSAGGTAKPQGGPGGQAAYRPMTPFSQGALGMGGMDMRGANTGMPPPNQMMSQGLGGLPMADMPRQQPMGQMGDLGQLASVIRSVGSQPMMQPAQQSMQSFQMPSPLFPFPNQSPQEPQQSSMMQQGLGGLSAYMGDNR